MRHDITGAMQWMFEAVRHIHYEAWDGPTECRQLLEVSRDDAMWQHTMISPLSVQFSLRSHFEISPSEPLRCNCHVRRRENGVGAPYGLLVGSS